MKIPRTLSSEQSTIGFILDSGSFDDLQALGLSEHDFLDKTCREIYNAASELSQKGSGTCIEELGILLPHRRVEMANLLEKAPITINIENLLKDLKKHREQRNVLKILIKNKKSIEVGEDDIIGKLNMDVAKLSESEASTAPKSQKEILGETLQNIEDSMTGKEKKFIDSHLSILNKSAVYYPGDLIIIGGRPGMGKTAFAINLANHFAGTLKKQVLFFSLEMTSEQINQRLLSLYSGVPVKAMRTGAMSEQQLDQLMGAARVVRDLSLYVDDEPRITFEKIYSKARIFKRKHGLDALFIDYLQIIKSCNNFNSIRELINHLTSECKQMAKELGCPVFLPAQLNRNSEGRPDPIPRLSDLKESGSIEQDADLILFIYRESYSDYEKKDSSQKKLIEDDQALISIAKNRHGDTGKILVGLDLPIGKFYNKQ